MAKETLSVRISSEAMQRLARLIEVRGAKSSGVVIEALIMSEPGPAPLVVDPDSAGFLVEPLAPKPIRAVEAEKRAKRDLERAAEIVRKHEILKRSREKAAPDVPEPERSGTVASAIDVLRSGKAPDPSHMTLAKDKWKKS